MAFAVPFAGKSSTRLKALELATGAEVRQGLDPMDNSYLKLLEAVGPDVEAQPEKAEKVSMAQRGMRTCSHACFQLSLGRWANVVLVSWPLCRLRRRQTRSRW